MKKRCLPAVFLIFIVFSVSAHATQEVEETLKAIVKIRSTIPNDARTARSLGTKREGNGVVIDSSGHILTIGYLILEAENIEVILPNSKPIRATFVGYDHDTGFGLMRADKPLGVTPFKLGQSSKVKEGDAILVAGHGGAKSVQGVRVVSRREFAGYWEYLLENAIFTSPPHADFAGAAMIGPDGRLLGIGSLFSQVVMPGVGVIPGNMFIPIDLLRPILGDLMATGRSHRPPRPWLGLHAEEVRGRVFVKRVTSGGPASQAGLKSGDIILAVAQKEVGGLADFYRKVWAIGRAGVDVPLSILQGNRMKNVIIRSADRFQFLRFK
ncbi:S1C family serine protease [Nitrospinota bacterium]